MAAKPEIIEAAKAGAERRTKGLSTGLESQRDYIRELHLMTPPCWNCAAPVSYYEAVGEDYAEEKYRGADEPFHCPNCHTKMVYVVPFVAIPLPWFWGNPKIYRKEKKADE
jgi:hypothetical protein